MPQWDIFEYISHVLVRDKLLEAENKALREIIDDDSKYFRFRIIVSLILWILVWFLIGYVVYHESL